MGYLQKEGLRPNPETPKTILDCNSAYKLHTKTMELPKLRTLKVEPQQETIGVEEKTWKNIFFI